MASRRASNGGSAEVPDQDRTELAASPRAGGDRAAWTLPVGVELADATATGGRVLTGPPTVAYGVTGATGTSGGGMGSPRPSTSGS